MLDEKNIHEIFDEEFLSIFSLFINNKSEYLKDSTHPYYKYSLFFTNILDKKIFNKDENFDVPMMKEFIKDIFYNLSLFSDTYYTNTKNKTKNTIYDNINILNDFGFNKIGYLKENKIKDFALNIISLFKRRVDANYTLNELLKYSIFNYYYSPMFLFKKKDELKFYRYDQDNNMVFYPFEKIIENNELWKLNKEDILKENPSSTFVSPINYGIVYRILNESNLYLYYLRNIVYNQYNTDKLSNLNSDITLFNNKTQFITGHSIINYIYDKIGNYLSYDKSYCNQNKTILNLTKDLNIDDFSYLNYDNIRQYTYIYNTLFNRPHCKGSEYNHIFDLYEINLDKYTFSIAYNADGEFTKLSENYMLNDMLNGKIKLNDFHNHHDYEIVKYEETDPDNIMNYNRDKIISLDYYFESIPDINKHYNLYVKQSIYENNKYAYISGGIDNSYLVSTENDNVYDIFIKSLIDFPYIPTEGNMNFNSYIKYDKDIIFNYRENISLQNNYLYEWIMEYDETLDSQKYKDVYIKKMLKKYNQLTEFKNNSLNSVLYDYYLDDEYYQINGVRRYYLKLKSNKFSILDCINNNRIYIYDKNSHENISNIKIDSTRYFIGHNIIRVGKHIIVLNGLVKNSEDELSTNDLIYKYDVTSGLYEMQPFNQFDKNLVNCQVFNYGEDSILVMGGYIADLENNIKYDNKTIYYIRFDENGNIKRVEEFNNDICIKRAVQNKKTKLIYFIEKNNSENKLKSLQLVNLTNKPEVLIMKYDDESLIPKTINNIDKYNLHFFNDCIYLIGGIDVSENTNSLKFNDKIYVLDLNTYINSKRFWFKINTFNYNTQFINNVFYTDEKNIYFIHPIFKKDNLFYMKNVVLKLNFDINMVEDFNTTDMSDQEIYISNDYQKTTIMNKNMNNQIYDNSIIIHETLRDEIHLRNKQISYYLEEKVFNINHEEFLENNYLELKIIIDEILENSDIDYIINEKNKIIDVIQTKLNILFKDDKPFDSSIQFNKNHIYDLLDSLKPMDLNILTIEEDIISNDIPNNINTISDHGELRMNIYSEDTYLIEDYSEFLGVDN
jgi:hypothetical protein